MISILAVLAFPVAFLAGGVAFNAMRSGETSLAVKSAAVCAICVAIYFAAPKKGVIHSDDCWTEWDGRANRTVCD